MDPEMSQEINLNGKTFQAVSNSDNGEISELTIFKYFQKGNLVWGQYEGGAIQKGHLLGKLKEANVLEFSYHHINNDLQKLTGKCTSTVSVTPSGKYLLNEKWQWTCKDYSTGESVLIETP